MKVAVFGLGYVGAVSGACLAELGHTVIGVDVNRTKVDMINRGEAPIVEEMVAELIHAAVRDGRLRATDDPAVAADCDVSLVSVGTPTNAAGEPDLTFVDNVVAQIGEVLRGGARSHTVIVRSTIPPGATAGRVAEVLTRACGEPLGDRIHLAFNPEFLREGRSVRDFKKPPFTVIGAMSERAYADGVSLYEGVESDIIRTEPAVAESIKLVSNAWHGLKVAFANEAGRILAGAGVDSREVMAVFARDDVLNISAAYLRPGFAFGGSCLPKDLRAMITLADRAATPAQVMRAALSSNAAHIDEAVRIVRTYGRRPVVMFGLAFKSGTDDLRESPFVALAEKLIGKGYRLMIIDPFVDASRLMGKNKEYIEREIPHFVEMISRDPEQAVDDAEIVIFGHATRIDKAAIIERGVGKVIIDLSGDDELADCGGDYHGMTW